MKLYPPVRISARLMPGVQINDSWVSINSESREPDGRLRTRYYIDTPDWEYEAADLFSGCFSTPTAAQALETLLAFLDSAAEQYRYYTLEKHEADDEPLFPPPVMEWAYLNEDEIAMLRLELEELENN